MRDYEVPIDFKELSRLIQEQYECLQRGHPNSKLVSMPAINIELRECLDCGTTYTVRIPITTVIEKRRNPEGKDSGIFEAAASS